VCDGKNHSEALSEEGCPVKSLQMNLSTCHDIVCDDGKCVCERVCVWFVYVVFGGGLHTRD
jgi:hypothetical protein